MIREGQKSFLRYCVDRVWRGKSCDIKNVRSVWVLGAGAGEKKSLRTCAKIGQTLPAVRGQDIAIGFVRLLTDGNAELVSKLVGHLFHRRAVPSTQEDRGYRPNVGTKARRNTPLKSTHVRVGRRQIVLAREKKRYVDGHTSRD